jgi:hypothetical protein
MPEWSLTRRQPYMVVMSDNMYSVMLMIRTLTYMSASVSLSKLLG